MSTKEITYWKSNVGNIWQIEKRPDGRFDWLCIAARLAGLRGARRPALLWITHVTLRERLRLQQVNRDGTPFLAQERNLGGGAALELVKEPEMEIKPLRWYKENGRLPIKVIKVDAFLVTYTKGENPNTWSTGIDFFLKNYKPCDPPQAFSSIKDPTTSYKEPKTVSIDYWPEHW